LPPSPLTAALSPTGWSRTPALGPALGLRQTGAGADIALDPRLGRAGPGGDIAPLLKPLAPVPDDSVALIGRFAGAMTAAPPEEIPA